jgi:hypothetical protein
MSSVTQMRTGRYLPSMRKASQVAEALEAPELLHLRAELGKRACEVCGRQYIEDHRGGYGQRWCSRACRDVGRKREKSAESRAYTLKRYDRWRRLALYRQGLIDTMCRSCEPDGACRQADCALRPGSPLPLLESEDVGVAAKGTVRLPPGSVLRGELTRARKAAWARRKRAAA